MDAYDIRKLAHDYIFRHPETHGITTDAQVFITLLAEIAAHLAKIEQLIQTKESTW